MENIRLHDRQGKRLYVTADERTLFFETAKQAEPEVRTFCHLLYYTGCRLSEARYLTPARIDMTEKVIVIESLKKRKRGHFRTIPVPDDFLDTLNMVHGLHKLPKRKRDDPIWDWSRVTAWRRVTEVLTASGIEEGAHRCPKGLRHGFAISAVLNNVPLTTVQAMLGHARIETTAIYLSVFGEEARTVVSRMWG